MLMLLIVVALWPIDVQHVGPIPLDMLCADGQALAEQGTSLAFLMLLTGTSAIQQLVRARPRPPAQSRAAARTSAATWSASSTPMSTVWYRWPLSVTFTAG
jgi:hypothetical protein